MIMSKKYRVGRKQRRVVLDENGIVVVEFPCGMEKDAQEYCEWRNQKAGKSIAFFDGIKDLYGIDVPDKDRMTFLINAGREIHDLRWITRTHPDQKMVESSCLHFLGDEAQIWWDNRRKKLKPLSELHKDEEACRRVAALLFGEPLSRNIGVNRWDGGTTFWYMGHSIDIEDDGEFGYEVTDSSSGKTVNIFALVDIIRELGYGSEN